MLWVEPEKKDKRWLYIFRGRLTTPVALFSSDITAVILASENAWYATDKDLRPEKSTNTDPRQN